MATPRNARRYRARVSLLGWLGAALLRVLGATWRVRCEGPDPFATGRPFVAAAWHRGMLVAAHHWRGRDVAVPVSRSRDGDMIDAVLGRLGYAPGPRGSSSQGATELLRESIRWVRGGGILGVLPDGPRGPAGEAKPGVVAIARACGVPLVPVGISASPCIQFGSWDRAILPLPFARVICRYGTPLEVPKSKDADALEGIRKRLEGELGSLDRELDAALGLRSGAAQPSPGQHPPRSR